MRQLSHRRTATNRLPPEEEDRKFERGAGVSSGILPPRIKTHSGGFPAAGTAQPAPWLEGIQDL